jgi:uncharacterized membrane protein YuzA (DUF378 family)
MTTIAYILAGLIPVMFILALLKVLTLKSQTTKKDNK